MKDIYDRPVSGHFIVQCLDESGTILDEYENHNLIMDKARTAMSNLICDLSSAQPLNKFVLGIEGHIPGDYLTPKTSVQGFISSRTNLFSEKSATFSYPIVFTNPGTSSGSCVVVSEPDLGSAVELLYVGTDVKYTIDIPVTAANGTGTVVYTEAALYAGTNIFSMKCFPGKIKDNTVSLRIIWTIKL